MAVMISHALQPLDKVVGGGVQLCCLECCNTRGALRCPHFTHASRVHGIWGKQGMKGAKPTRGGAVRELDGNNLPRAISNWNRPPSFRAHALNLFVLTNNCRTFETS